MKRFKHKGLYVLLLIALVLSLLFPASTMAATDFVADSGVYDLVGDSINAHSDAVYLWQHGGYIFVAISSSMNDKQLGAVTVNGEEPEELYWRDTLTVNNADDPEGDPFIENEDPPAKTATSYRWLIAQVEIEISEEIVLNVGGPGGHALVNVVYTVQGALNVFHEYPPDDPFQDFGQSVPSNTIGGLAADEYLVEPENPLKVGYDYSSVTVKIDGTELLSVDAGASGNASFAHGSVAIDSSGVVTVDLTSTSDKIFDINYLYGLAVYNVSLSVEPTGSGTVTGAGTYNFGDSVTVEATPETGWAFVNWTDDDDGDAVVSTDASYTFDMPAYDVNLTANFAKIDYTLSLAVAPSGSGVVTGAGSYNFDAVVSITATANEGWEFVNWTEGTTVVSTAPDFDYTMPARNVTLTANFAKIDYTLSLAVAPSGSGVVTGDGSYNFGDVVPITATANVGWEFVNWTEGDTVVSTAPDFDYTMPARNVTLTANFEQIPDELDGEWVEETAWAYGPRYTPRGNWATYTPYVANSTVILYAGQHMEAGTVHFSASTDGKVTITITLANGWRFEDVKENVKIQDYSVAPKGNPAPGRFAYKANATGMSFNMDVAYNNFYGVHVNVEWLK